MIAHKFRILAAALAATATAQAGEQPVEVRLGVDDGGSYHWWTTGRPSWEYPAYFRALEEIGAGFVSVHVWPVTDAGAENPVRTLRRLSNLDDAMREHKLDYTINVELSNWLPRLEVTPGVDEFEHQGGVHRWDVRMEWLSALLPPARPGRPALAAITYDECEHMILSNNKFSNSPANSFDKPYLVETHGLPLEVAYERLSAEAERIRIEHYENRVIPQTEQVWPDLFHIFARAGWVVTPKLLKENISPVIMSIAMGAALQYREAGARLWASPDLWNYGAYPGHSPQALRSALLMGYWLGAETLYVENFDFDEWSPRHPQADAKGSLIRWSNADTFEFTAHGRVVREFYRDYVPAHPRPIDWRDCDPRVAIIRLPDGGWGQYASEHGEVESRNRLLGNRDLPLDESASQWLHVWPILTHGVVRPGAISTANRLVYPKGLDDFFAPIDSVAVFDHTVLASHLANIECMIVCGHALSAPTFQAVRDRAAGGGTVIISRKLYDQHASGTLAGDWLILDDFNDPRLAEKLAPFLGPPDVARFRFKRHIVEFHRGGEPESMTVRVRDRN